MRFVVIGSGKTAIDTARILKFCDSANLVGLVGDPRHETAQSSVAALAGKLSLPFAQATRLTAPEIIDFVRSMKPDYIISANNYMLFKAEMLAIPTYGTVNFHNGPLPDYAGLNPISWAILNGDSEYGIAWHFVDEGIDTGDIVHVERFSFEPDITAIGAIMKVVLAGLSSFKSVVLPDLLAGTFRPAVQDVGLRRYFAATDRPAGGELPWWWPAWQLERLSRALWFAPLSNGFYRPRLAFQNGLELFVERFEFINKGPQASVGCVGNVTEKTVEVGCDGGVLRLHELQTTGDIESLSAKNPVEMGVKTGDVLRRPEQANEG